MIYLDHNATTPLDERVLEAMLPYLASAHGNPSSLYRAGRIARDAMEMAREQVAALVGASPAQVIFTSGGTEANNLALKGLAWSLPRGRICVGATEHPAVLEPARFLAQQGWKMDCLAVDESGRISEEALSAAFLDPPRIASVMLANNETGVIHDLGRIVGRLREHGTFIHCDAVQGIGKLAVDFAALGVHLMTLSAHKIYGPKGIGALVLDPATPMVPLIHGGGQERGLRGGTENVAAIVGFGKAAELAASELFQRREHLLRLRLRLERGLAGLPGVTVFARAAERLPNTVLFALAGYDGEALVMLLDRKGFAVSSGSACASGAAEPSHVLLAMGIDAGVAQGAVRVSLGRDNGEAEVDRLLEALREIVGDRRPCTQPVA
jgi:cysteine desulfurase